MRKRRALLPSATVRHGSFARQAWTELRLHGPRGLLGRVWRRYVCGQDRFVVLVGSIRTAALEYEPDGITIGRATRDDIAALPSLSPQGRRIEHLVEHESAWLHVAHDADRLIGYRLATRSFSGRGVLARVVQLEADQVYVDHIFVHPDYRRHNIGRRLILSQNADLIASGFRQYVTAVAVENVASLRLTIQHSGRPILFVDSSRRVFLHRCTVSPLMPPGVQRLVDELGGAR